MRSDFLMALLVCGTLIVALPPISDQMHNRNVVELLSRPNTDTVYLDGRMSSDYRAGCYVLGAGMIFTAVVASLVSGSRSRRAVAAVGGRDPRLVETVMMPQGAGAG
ncbi:MAG TPA: hypothetical protein VF170_08290 [Planctomycetaceae bacterium]